MPSSPVRVAKVVMPVGDSRDPSAQQYASKLITNAQRRFELQTAFDKVMNISSPAHVHANSQVWDDVVDTALRQALANEPLI